MDSSDNLEELIEIYGGGRLSDKTIKKVEEIFNNNFENLIKSISSFPYSKFFTRMKNSRIKDIELVFTEGVNLRADSLVTENGKGIILVPVGLIVRAKVLFTYLIQYWNKPDIKVLNSPLDYNWELVKNKLSKEIKPIFEDYSQESSEEFWNDILLSHKETSFEKIWQPDQMVVLETIINVALLHELAHLVNDHQAFRQAIQENPGKTYLGIDKELLFTGIELNADFDSGNFLIHWFYAVVISKSEEFRFDLFVNEFLRHGYALVMYFGAFDQAMKSLYSYSLSSSYCHPIVRHLHVIDGIYHAFNILFPGNQEVARIFNENETAGFRKCDSALAYLSQKYCEEGSLNLLLTGSKFGPSKHHIGLEQGFSRTISLVTRKINEEFIENPSLHQLLNNISQEWQSQVNPDMNPHQIKNIFSNFRFGELLKNQDKSV